jgi:c-di-AMP phosphodiesterase-like protein
MLIFLLKKRKDIPVKSSIYISILFIFCCALTHIMEIVNVWIPYYMHTGLVKSFTAIVSIVATVVLYRNLKKIIELPSFEELGDKLFHDMSGVMEQLPIGIILADARQGSISYSNHYVSQLFGYSNKELIGQKIELLLPNALREKHVAL